MSLLFAEPAVLSKVTRISGWLGVDFGSAAVKVACLERSGSRVKLHFARAATLPSAEERGNATFPARLQARMSYAPAAFENQCAANFAASTQLPQKEVNDEAMTTFQALAAIDAYLPRHIACTLPTQAYEVYCRQQTAAVDLAPTTGQSNDEGKIPGDLIPEVADREYATWPACQSDESNETGLWMVSSIEAETAANLAKRVEQCGNQCVAIDVAPFALARAAELVSESQTGRLRAILDIGMRNVMFVCCHAGQPFYTRVLKCPGVSQIARSLGERLQISAEDSRILFQQLIEESSERQSFHDCRHVRNLLSESSEVFLSQLTNEISKTLQYLRQHVPASYPNQLILSGCGAALPELWKQLEDELNVPTRVWQIDRLESVPASGYSVEPLFAKAVGLSMGGWAP